MGFEFKMYSILLLFIMVSIFPRGVTCTELGKLQAGVVVPNDFATIQSAIDAASEGSRVNVKRGVYYEHIVLSKRIILTGEEGATIQGDSKGFPIVKIYNVNLAEIRGFRLIGFNKSSYAGILVKYSVGVFIAANYVSDCYYGIEVYDSNGLTLQNNRIEGNRFNLKIWGLVMSHFEHSIDISNTVNSKPVYYWIDKHAGTVPLDAGYVALINCSGVFACGLATSANTQGILLAYTRDSTVFNCSFGNNEYGLHVLNSHGNLILNNSIEHNLYGGMFLDSSRNNTIAGNRAFLNEGNGLLVSTSAVLNFPSENNSIIGNDIERNRNGITVEYSEFNPIRNNIIKENKVGVLLRSCQNVRLSQNTIQNNGLGLFLEEATYSVVYGNNFVDNSVQARASVHAVPAVNWWNLTYDINGNYWSNYNGSDNKRGEDQMTLGADGIGDTPFLIGEGNLDYLPLIAPHSSDEVPSADFSFSPTIAVVKHDQIVFQDGSFDTDGYIIFRVWCFEDGSVSTEASPERMFSLPGVSNVVLFVVDDSGNVATSSHEVVVRKIKSKADLSGSTDIKLGDMARLTIALRDEFDSPLAGLSFRYDVDKLQGSLVTNESGMATFTHSFKDEGVYVVKIAYDGDAVTEGCEVLSTITVSRDYSILLLVLVSVFCLAGILALSYRRWGKSRLLRFVCHAAKP